MEAIHSKINRPFVLCRILKKKNEINYVVQQLGGGMSGTVNVKNMKKHNRVGQEQGDPKPTEMNIMGQQTDVSVSFAPQVLSPGGQGEAEVENLSAPLTLNPPPTVPEAIVGPEEPPLVLRSGIGVQSQPEHVAAPHPSPQRVLVTPTIPVVTSPVRLEPSTEVIRRTSTRERHAPIRYRGGGESERPGDVNG